MFAGGCLAETLLGRRPTGQTPPRQSPPQEDSPRQTPSLGRHRTGQTLSPRQTTHPPLRRQLKQVVHMHASYWNAFLLPPAMKLGQGNIFRSMCQQVCPQGGGMCGCSGGCAWLHQGGHAWFYLGGAWFYLGVCMVLFGGHAWFYLGGMHGFIWEACVVLFRWGVHGFFSFFGYNEIRSMSGRYASYWNAFLY